MKQFLVVANLKMNLLTKDLIPYLNIVNECKEKNLIMFPSSIYIPYFLKHEYQVGIQNVYYENESSYTGEISPKQASSMGVSYALIGHSDRRLHFNETDADINKKIIKCLESGLKVILCIGETLEERNMMKTSRVLKRQLMSDLRGVTDFSNVYIAYEPIWAIGTGRTPSNQDIKDVVNYIKEMVLELNQYEDVKVLYGGSIDENNIDFVKMIPNICGVIVGNHSKDARKILKIVQKCK